ncbi:MAG: MBL fold metallo-hydrolase [Hyphomicrobiales bacterium]|nr:MBL fold metallo-hydrolase [Hyphomicrobiales bacterium]
MRAKCIAPTGANATRYKEPQAYREGLYDLGQDLFAWMVPNGSWGEANAGLVTGRGESLLIDTLWDVPKTSNMLEAMSPVLERAPLAACVNTHADGDHFWGNQLLGDIDTVTSERARTEMNHHKPASLLAFERLGRVLARLPGKKTRAAGRYFKAMCAPYDFASVTHTPAARSFTGTLELSVGGREVRLIEVGPAHTQGDLIVHVADAKALFAADILFIDCTPVMWAGPVANWLKALDLILDLDVTTIVPGHGPITDKDGVKQVRDYWDFTAQAAKKQFDAGTNATAAAHAIVASADFANKPFAAWDSPERMMTNVHMLYREFAGQTAPLGVPAKVNLMRKQAVLAHSLRDASPVVMHG